MRINRLNGSLLPLLLLLKLVGGEGSSDGRRGGGKSMRCHPTLTPDVVGPGSTILKLL